MPKIILARDKDGQLYGLGEVNEKRFAKFKYIIANLGDSSIEISYHLPRSGPFHRRFFAILNAIYDAQTSFSDFDMFRKWLTVGAAYAEFIPSPSGTLIAIPKSIDYASLDQHEFTEIADKIIDFARSEHARKHMWPWLTDEGSQEMLDVLLKEFD